MGKLVSWSLPNIKNFSVITEFLPEILSAIGSVTIVEIARAIIFRQKNRADANKADAEAFALSLENRSKIEQFWSRLLEGREDIIEEFNKKLVELERELLSIRDEYSKAKKKISILEELLTANKIEIPADDVT